MRAIKGVVAGALLLVGCDNPNSSAVDSDETKAELALLRSQLGTLRSQVDRQGDRLVPDEAYMKPGERGFSWMQTGPMIFRIALIEIKPSGNGSSVEFAVGNLMAMGVRDCIMSASWGSTDASGQAVPSTQHSADFNLGESIPAGDFAYPNVTLADLPPAKLGYVTVTRIRCLRNAF